MNTSSNNAAEVTAKHLPREVEEGNVEYKLMLVGVTPERREHLITQMNWRLNEGTCLTDGGVGEAVYQIGFSDDGSPTGLADHDFNETVMTLKSMAKAINARAVVQRVERGYHGKVAKVLVRRIEESIEGIDQITVATIGDAGIGKSTLTAVLTSGELDNGFGLARMQVLRHNHEIEEGHTSSPSKVLLGYAANGTCTNYDTELNGCGQRRGASQVIENACRLVNLIDLAGHPKYLKTTVKGLLGHKPEYVMLSVDASRIKLENLGRQGEVSTSLLLGHMGAEHLSVALALETRVFITITKTDLVSAEELDHVEQQVDQFVEEFFCRSRHTVAVRSFEHVGAVCTALATESPSSAMSYIPVLRVSSVNGDGIDILNKFLFRIPCWGTVGLEHRLETDDTIVRVTASFVVPDVGIVIGGSVQQGTVPVGSRLMMGPDHMGKFHPVRIQSIHLNGVSCKAANVGQTATFAIEYLQSQEKMLKHDGMVLISQSVIPHIAYEFEADVTIVERSKSLSVDREPIVHVQSVVQSARITAICESKGAVRHLLQHTASDLRAEDDQIKAFSARYAPICHEAVQAHTGRKPHPSHQLDSQEPTKCEEAPRQARGQTNSSHGMERASVKFRFLYKPEYISPGDCLVLREGGMRGFGRITSCKSILACV